MIIITQQRHKCIGCNYCVELAPDRWIMSDKDGKSVLVEGKGKGGFFTARAGPDEFDTNQRAADACPVKIISIKAC